MLKFQKAFVIMHSLSGDTNVFKFWMKPNEQVTTSNLIHKSMVKSGHLLDKTIPRIYNPKFVHALVTDNELPLVSTPKSIADRSVMIHTKALFMTSTI